MKNVYTVQTRCKGRKYVSKYQYQTADLNLDRFRDTARCHLLSVGGAVSARIIRDDGSVVLRVSV